MNKRLVQTLLFLTCSMPSYKTYSQCLLGEPFLIQTDSITACPEGEYELVFHDEFDGNTLDLSKWRTKTSSPPPFDRTLWQNCERELQFYTDTNFVLQNGILQIIAEAKPHTYQGVVGGNIPFTCNDDQEILYTPGEEFSEEFEFTSGRIEAVESFAVRPQENFIMTIRCRVPKGVGLWPAFWMWNIDEIDVFEYFGTKPGCGTGSSTHFQTAYIKSSCSICPIGYEPKCPKDYNPPFVGDLTDDFHVYSVEVTAWYIKWYFDGTLIRTAARFYTYPVSSPIGTYCGAFLPSNFVYGENLLFTDVQENRYFRPIANLAIHQACSPEEVTGLPAKFEIDYIRVYKRLTNGDDENLCYYEIEGPETLCYGYNNKYDYVLKSNIPVGEVVWSTSSNLAITDAAGNEVTVRMSSFSEGSGWIRAEIPGIGFCQDSVFTFNVQTVLPFSGVVNSNGSTQTLNFFNYVTDNYPSITLDNVIIESLVRINGSNYATYRRGGNEIFISLPNNGFYHFRVNGVAEGCGEVSQEFIFIHYPAGGSHILSPNPATTEINIVANSPEHTIPFTDEVGNPATLIVSPLIKGIKIFDVDSGILSIQNDYDTFLPETSVNITHLNSGNYLIEVLRKDDLKDTYSFIKI
ncbi:MAG: glycoside hydrolase family 16 protein [Phaeodactylibacter sp.]|nr:glycoside hydrolase family 16 protein [Phaeodactylibacter sp.]